MKIYYYHKDPFEVEFAAMYTSIEEAQKAAADFNEKLGFPGMTEIADTDPITFWQSYAEWMFFKVPPVYFINDRQVLRKAKANGYNALVELLENQKKK